MTAWTMPGNARGGIDLDVAIEVLVGPMIYRTLISAAGPAALAGLPESLFELVARGLAPRG